MVIFDWANLDQCVRSLLGAGAPIWSHSNSLVTSSCFETHSSVGNGSIEYHHWSDGIKVLILDCEFSKIGRVQTQDRGGIRLNFAIAVGVDMASESRIFNESSSLSWRVVNSAPSAFLIEDWHANERNTYLTIHCSHEALAKTVGLEVTDLPDLFRPKKTAPADEVSIDTFICGPLMSQILINLDRWDLRSELKAPYVRSQAIALMCLAVDQLTAGETTDRLLAPTNEENQKAREIASFIESELAELPPLEQICRKFATNRNKLNQVLRSVFGMGFAQLVESARLRTAFRLIAKSELPFEKVARRVGFAHQSTLTSMAKRKFGQTPKQIRKSHQGTA